MLFAIINPAIDGIHRMKPINTMHPPQNRRERVIGLPNPLILFNKDMVILI